MGETRTRSIRVGDDVWEAIQALPGKTDDALRAVLVNRKVVADPHVEINRWFRETWKRLEDLPAEILEAAEAKRAQKNGSRPAAVAPTSSGSDMEVIHGFPIQCVHCGQRGSGSSKYATICIPCKRSGHTLQPAECPICTAGSAI